VSLAIAKLLFRAQIRQIKFGMKRRGGVTDLEDGPTLLGGLPELAPHACPASHELSMSQDIMYPPLFDFSTRQSASRCEEVKFERKSRGLR